MDLQGDSPGGVSHQGDGLLRAVGHAHPTAHAGGAIDDGVTIIHRNRPKRAVIGALAAAGAQIGVHLGHIARGGQHRRAVLVGVHGAAATGTAVADGVEPAEHGIFVVVGTMRQVRSP